MVPIAQLFTPLAVADVLANLLNIAQGLGLPVTTWQSGDPSKTLLNIFAQGGQFLSSAQSTIIQGGFLDYAAAVTPDPSVTPGAPAGWLDVLASSRYNVSNGAGGTGRIQAQYASGNLTFTNSGASAGPYAPGTFHVASTGTGTPTYSNTQTLTIASGTTIAPFAADVAGTTGNAAAGLITSTLTTVLGVSVTNAQGFVGVAAESNAALVARCRAKMASLSPNGPAGAYDYFSRTIPPPAPLATLTSGSLKTPKNPVTRTKQVVDTTTGIVTNYVASAAGVYVAPDLYTGSVNETITGVTNVASPHITVTAHGYSTGDNVYITGTGLAVLDGFAFTITVLDANTFTVTPTAAPGATSSTGTAYRQSDMDLIAKTVQAYAAPLTATVTTTTAPAKNISITGTIYLRKTSTLTNLQATTTASTALTTYFAGLPLGGNDLGGGTYYFLIEPMERAVANAMPNDVLEVIITSPASDVAVSTAQDVATLSGSPAWTVTREI